MKPSKFEVYGFEMLVKVTSSDKRSSASCYVPKSWAGKKIAVVRLEK